MLLFPWKGKNLNYSTVPRTKPMFQYWRLVIIPECWQTNVLFLVDFTSFHDPNGFFWYRYESPCVWWIWQHYKCLTFFSYFLPCKMLQPSDSCTWVSRSHSVPSPPCSSWCSRPATRHSTPTRSPCPPSRGSWSAPDIPATSSRWSSHEGWFICDVLCKENPKSKAESIKGIDTTMWLGKKGSKLELHFCCWFFTHPELTK